jgi:hypothetical protein
MAAATPNGRSTPFLTVFTGLFDESSSGVGVGAFHEVTDDITKASVLLVYAALTLAAGALLHYL